MSAPAPFPLLVLALDGATFDVIDPLAEAGRLPNLERWRSRGVALPLRSTSPPMSFPAWSTFMTGLEPGAHGIFDFTQKLEGAYRLRFVNATDRRGESLFARASRAGARTLVLGMPACYPPEPLRGLLVAGFDAPVSAGSAARSASDPALYRRIASRVGPWMRADVDEGATSEVSDARHEHTIERLLERVDRKRDFALAALEELRGAGGGPDLAVIVFSESDTVSHHYWRDHDPASPRHDPRASAARKAAVSAVYERLDAACGEIRAAFGEDALCVVASDHGSGGASRRVVHLNRRLAEGGLLRRASPRGGGVDLMARSARDAALRALPPRAAERLFRRARGAAARIESAARFGGMDWGRTAAFSEEANTQPGVWINLRGREAAGCVEPDDYERVRDEVIDGLLDWELPDGRPVVRHARRREEVYAGACRERAPDVVLELALDAGYGLSLLPTPWAAESPTAIRSLADHELGGGRGRGMNGTHRPDGIWIADGPGSEAFDDDARPSLCDAAPTLLHAMGIEWDGERDGAPLSRLPAEYTPEEEGLVAARLRALGYLE